MVTASESVVTEEKFKSGLSWEGYLGQLEKGRPRYEENYNEFKLSDEDAAFFKDLAQRPGGPARVLVITEWWCPDCFREVPVAVKIAEAAGMELRVVARDEHLDVMSEFLRNGEFQSIPVFVFYTSDGRYLGHWIERTKLAYEETHLLREATEGKSKEEQKESYIAFQKGPTWANWRDETVKELKDLLGGAAA
ncbi:MAG: thioredoxin family protein [Dehalococcoidia bacterium]